MNIIEILATVFFSSFRFAMTFPLVILQFESTIAETLIWTNAGGLAGIMFFAYLSEMLIAWWKRNFKPKGKKDREKSREKKTFTKRNRRIVRIKQRYGLPGIALITPFLLSIPLGVFLVIRYYRSNRYKYLYLLASNILWSLAYTWFYMFADGLLFTKAS